MKRVFLAALGVSAALAVGGCMHGDWGTPYRASVDESRPLAKDGHFSLENTNGRVEIAGWDEAKVEIEAVKHARSERALEDLKVEIVGEGDHLRVRSRHPRRHWLGGAGRVDYHVRVPRTARVSVENVNGRVEIRGVTAQLEASTVNGTVEVADAASEVDASAVNGRVEVGLARVDPDAHSRLHTTNGTVRLTLPPGTNADVEASAVNGSVRCDFEVEGGRKTRRKLEGRIGSGGARFDLSAVNGSVRIDRGLSEARAESKPPAEAEPQADVR